jgi:hypothetical protein
LGAVADAFWAVVNFFVLLVSLMFDPAAAEKIKSNPSSGPARKTGGGGPGSNDGGPGGRRGRIVGMDQLQSAGSPACGGGA